MITEFPDSLNIAKERGMQVTFGVSDLKEAHPNTAQLRLTGDRKKT